MVKAPTADYSAVNLPIQEKVMTTSAQASDSRYIDTELITRATSDADIDIRNAAIDSNRKVRKLPTWVLTLIPALLVIAGLSYVGYLLYFSKPKDSAYGVEEAELIGQANNHKDNWNSNDIPFLRNFRSECTITKKCPPSKSELANFSRTAGLVYYRFAESKDCKVQTMRSSAYTGPDPATPGMNNYAIEALKVMASILKSDDINRLEEEVLRREAFVAAYSHNGKLRELVSTATRKAKQVLSSSCPHITDGEKEFLSGEYPKQGRN